MISKFKVGEFYKVQPFAGKCLESRKINCLCVRRSKKKVWFQYINMDFSGVYEIKQFFRWVKPYIPQEKSVYDEVEEAYSPSLWESVAPTKATEVGVKPRIWDDIKEVR